MDLPWQEILIGLVSLVTLLIGIANRKLKSILTETRNNGGSTIKDQLDRIEGNIKSLNLWVEASQHLTAKPMFKADGQGKFIWVNIAFARMLGVGIEDLKGLGWVDFIDDTDVDRVVKEWNDSIKDKRKFEAIFKVRNILNANINRVKARAFPVLNNGDALGYVGTWIIIEEVLDLD